MLIEPLRAVRHRARASHRRHRNLRAARHRTAEQVWEAGTTEEVAFWRAYLKSRGDGAPDEYRFRLDPAAPLQEHVIRWLPDMGNRVRILDVGAGPLTSLGKVWPGHDVELVPVDALADQFEPLLLEFGIGPPARTIRCDGEHLTERFAPGSFDVACAFNALDHCYDPIRCLREMAAVVRPGGISAPAPLH